MPTVSQGHARQPACRRLAVGLTQRVASDTGNMFLTLDGNETAAGSASRDLERNAGVLVNSDGVCFTTASSISQLSKEQLERSPILMQLSESYGSTTLPCTQEEFSAWLRFDCCPDTLAAGGDDGLCQLLKVCQRAVLSRSRQFSPEFRFISSRIQLWRLLSRPSCNRAGVDVACQAAPRQPSHKRCKEDPGTVETWLLHDMRWTSNGGMGSWRVHAVVLLSL